jgi:hypothetical protein
VPRFYFVVGDISDGAVSATAVVEADSLEAAKSAVTDYLAEAKVKGGPPGVIPLCTGEKLLIHVRVTPEAVADTANWENQDGETPTADDAIPNKEAYLRDAGYCPFCRSIDIEGESIDIEGESAYQDVECADCEAQWRDEYRLKNVRVVRRPLVELGRDGIVRCSGCDDAVDRRSTCRECRQCTACCSCHT